MTDPQVALVMLSSFIVIILLGFPVAFTLLAMGVGFGYYAYYDASRVDTFADLFNNNIFYLLNQNTYSVMENDTLVAIPLFLFLGYVVERANIVNKLFYSLQMAARNLPGSMAIAALITCAVFSTASGIVGAVVTLMGLLAYPAMAKANYDKSFCFWRHLRRRHAWYFDSALDHVDRLCGNCRSFASAPIRRRHSPRVPPGRIVHCLRHYPRHD